jgi:peptidoglycan hydrolase-like protein with peptidoglycan-binding domain
MTAVHDRGGAIVPAASEDGSGPKYDRLDVWMGYGDKGLQRALDWGFRTVEVTVYGIDDSIQEQVEIAGYSEDEKYNQEYFYIPEYENSVSSPVTVKSITVKKELFPEDLWYLSQGDGVKKLQEYLTQLGYFNGIINGYFGDDTRMAIYVFQKDKGIVQDITELGAGHFGPATRKALEDTLVSKKQEFFPKVTLGINSNDKDTITKLQKALKLAGYDVEVTGKYDSKTVDAVFKFQTDNKIVSGDSDIGAGYFGPKTMTTLTAKLNDLFKDGKVKIIVAHADDEIGIMITSKQVLTPPMNTDLKPGDSGPEVSRLQAELRNLNLLRIDPTGTYGDVTQHAVFKFQQRYGLVADEASEFAGIFGPQTRQKLNEIIASKNYYNKKIAEKRVNKPQRSVVASND